MTKFAMLALAFALATAAVRATVPTAPPTSLAAPADALAPFGTGP
jgi:hypothetical protein